MAEMRQVAEGVAPAEGRGASGAPQAALARIVHTPEPLDVREARDRFDAMLAGRLDAQLGHDVGRGAGLSS